MRVDLECSCGAKLGIGYEVPKWSSPSSAPEVQKAEKLIEQFRRDHKECRKLERIDLAEALRRMTLTESA